VRELLAQHWKLLLIACLALGGYAWLHAHDAANVRLVQELNDSHRTEIQEIDRARAEEKREHLLEEEQFRDAMAAIESRYADAQAQLVHDHAEERRTIVARYGNDAGALAQLAADRLGLQLLDGGAP